MSSEREEQTRCPDCPHPIGMHYPLKQGCAVYGCDCTHQRVAVHPPSPRAAGEPPLIPWNHSDPTRPSVWIPQGGPCVCKWCVEKRQNEMAARAAGEETSTPEPPLDPRSTKGWLPLSESQRSEWMLSVGIDLTSPHQRVTELARGLLRYEATVADLRSRLATAERALAEAHTKYTRIAQEAADHLRSDLAASEERERALREAATALLEALPTPRRDLYPNVGAALANMRAALASSPPSPASPESTQ